MRYDPLAYMQEALELIRTRLYGPVPPIQGLPTRTGNLPIVTIETISQSSIAEAIRASNTGDNLAFYVRDMIKSLLSEMISRRYLSPEYDLTRLDVLIDIRDSGVRWDDRRLLLGVIVNDGRTEAPLERFLVTTVYNGIYNFGL